MRIPGIIDLRKIGDGATIRAAENDPLLDRRHEKKGPLVNRLLASRLRSTLRTDKARLPSALPRGDSGRQSAQEALKARLDASPRIVDPETLAGLAAAIRGDSGARPLGPLALQAVGRLFGRGYGGDEAGWKAALDFDAGVRAGLGKLLLLLVTGRLRRARKLLSARAGGDGSAVHGTGIAVHTLVTALERMKALWRDSPADRRPAPAEAADLSLRPPARVVRQATAAGDSAAGPVRPGTILLFELAAAYDRGSDRNLLFMSESWTACPAEQAVRRLLAEVWQEAGTAHPAPPWFPPCGDLRKSNARQRADRSLKVHRIVMAAAALAHLAAAILVFAGSDLAARLLGPALGWPPLTGALMLGLALWIVSVAVDPLRARLATATLVGVQLLLGVTLIVASKQLLPAGLAEIALALAVAATYWRLLVAELMTRP